MRSVDHPRDQPSKETEDREPGHCQPYDHPAGDALLPDVSQVLDLVCERSFQQGSEPVAGVPATSKWKHRQPSEGDGQRPEQVSKALNSHIDLTELARLQAIPKES